MKRLNFIAIVAFLVGAVMASPAQAAFGVDQFDLGFSSQGAVDAQQAGSHPDSVTTYVRFNSAPAELIEELPEGAIRDLEVTLPEGLVGRPGAVPSCSDADFRVVEGEPPISRCPDGTAVGLAVIKGSYLELKPGEVQPPLYVTAPIFNLTPAPGSVQKIGFWVQGLVPVVVEFQLTDRAPYRVVAKAKNVNQLIPLYSTKLIIWGNPASPVHDSERGHCVESFNATEQETINTIPGCSIPAGFEQSPYVTLGTSCGNPLEVNYLARSWEGASDAGASAGKPLTGCNKLRFTPTTSVTPTTSAAQASAGLDFNLDVADEGLTNPTGIAQSDIRRTEVTLPEGMTVNPSLAEGLGACSGADLARETLAAQPGQGCPQSSKIGTVEVETPLLEESIDGNLYVAKPFENEAGSLLAVYLVIKNPKLGVIVKQTLKVLPNERNGQLTAIADEIPQIPFSHFRLKFRGGERAPLTSPSGCGTYAAKSVMTPWSGGPPVTSNSTFQITTGAGGGACGPAPFAPSFEAGTVTPLAGAHSPFILRLTRPPGSPRLSAIQATLPQGLLGKLAGVGECSEAQIAAARNRNAPNQGALELAAPSCPQNSELGSVMVGAGSGSQTYVGGRAYLAGPYKGAPLSLVIITPAITGPFDLGSVVVRNALYVNSTTAQINAVSDPLPTILDGIPLDIRSILVNLDRPGFTLNPTSCEPMAVLGGATSLLGQTSLLSSRFQAGGCRDLKFAPKLTLTLSGKTKRTGNPALKAVLTQPKGQANIDKVSVVLPRSEFIDNRHLNNPCTRPQFSEGKCPATSILGRARAYTPLLDGPLSGKVYLRSNGGARELPDLVVALRGRIDIDLVGYIDSVGKKGSEISRVRNRFALVPDAPVTKFVLELAGGKKGILQNSVNLCAGKNRAVVKMEGQNGKSQGFSSVVKASCGKKKR